MNTNYSNASMLDMVFEHRNKAYGAYVLRRDANKTTKQAMLYILSVVTVFCLGNFIRENIKASKKTAYVPNHVFNATDVGKITPPAQKVKPHIEPPKHPQTAKAIPTIANTEKKVVADNKAPLDSIPTNKDLANLEPGIKTNTTASPGMGATDGNGQDAVFEVAKQAQPPTPNVFVFVEQMPEFPGGDKALMEFLAQNIDYPRMEKENDIAGKVISQFTVNEDGTVSDIQILRSTSGGFNKEATRVIKMLPRFKPGMQQGRAVKVRFNMPIIFKLN